MLLSPMVLAVDEAQLGGFHAVSHIRTHMLGWRLGLGPSEGAYLLMCLTEKAPMSFWSAGAPWEGQSLCRLFSQFLQHDAVRVAGVHMVAQSFKSACPQRERVWAAL